MLEQILLPLVLAFLMFGLGLSLQLADFSRFAKRWNVVFTAVCSILVVMPVCAYLIGRLTGLEPALAAGLLLLATCPGGMFSNMITHSGSGNVALSLTLTVCTSLVYAVGMPLGVVILGGAAANTTALSLPLFKMVAEMLSVVLLPLAVGMWMRHRRPELSEKYAGFVRNASSVLIAIVFVVLAIKQFEQFKTSGMQIVVAVLLLNLAGWLLASLLVGTFRLTSRELIAIGAEHSIRQEGTGVFVAVTILSRSDMVPPLLTNSFVGFLVSVLFLTLINTGARLRRQDIVQPTGSR